MQLLTLEQVLKLHKRVIEQSGGAMGIRNQEGLESAVAQPRMSYADQELSQSLIEKVAAFGFSLIKNHPFVDGNKRIGHAAIEVTLLMNGYEIQTELIAKKQLYWRLPPGACRKHRFSLSLKPAYSGLQGCRGLQQ